MPNLAKKVQTRIESLYDVKLIKNIEDFITDKTKHVEDFIKKDKKIKYTIHENNKNGFIYCKIFKDKLESLIYINPEVIKNLNKNNPFNSLNKKNITDFLVLVEEVDHWEYINNKFQLRKTPSNFEIELQAAVTKYWLSIRLMVENKHELTEKDKDFLMFNVFPKTCLKLNIDGTLERGEYHIPELIAKDYCEYLTRKEINTILFSLRKFYRMDGKEKVDYIMRDFKKNPVL